jgi:hypothetical protein
MRVLPTRRRRVARRLLRAPLFTAVAIRIALGAARGDVSRLFLPALSSASSQPRS